MRTRRWIYVAVAVAVIFGILIARREAVEIARVEVVRVLGPPGAAEAPPLPARDTEPLRASPEDMTHFRVRIALSRPGHVAVLTVDHAGAVTVAWPPPDPYETIELPAEVPLLVPPPEEVPWPLPDSMASIELLIAGSPRPISRRDLVDESSLLVRGTTGRAAAVPLVRSLLESRVGPARIVRVDGERTP